MIPPPPQQLSTGTSFNNHVLPARQRVEGKRFTCVSSPVIHNHATCLVYVNQHDKNLSPPCGVTGLLGTSGGSSIATSMVLEESPDGITLLQIIIYYHHVYNDRYICICHLILSCFDMDIVYVFG